MNDWALIAERARGALSGCRSVRARVHVNSPVDGRTHGDAHQSTLDVLFARPDLWRVDRDGELVLLRDGIRHLARGESGGMVRHRRDPEWIPGDEIGGLGWGHPDLFRDPAAFETPVGGPVPATVFGRDAWEVELAAPGRKPYVLRLAVDQASGLVLRYEALGTPYVAEVVELVLDQDLPPETFAWDGEVEERRIVDPEDSAEDDVVEDLPLPRFWPTEPSWTVERVDPATGAFQARLSRSFSRSLLVRHPVDGVLDWEIEGSGHRHERSDDRWHWTLFVDEPLSEADLDRVWRSIS